MKPIKIKIRLLGLIFMILIFFSSLSVYAEVCPFQDPPESASEVPFQVDCPENCTVYDEGWHYYAVWDVENGGGYEGGQIIDKGGCSNPGGPSEVVSANYQCTLEGSGTFLLSESCECWDCPPSGPEFSYFGVIIAVVLIVVIFFFLRKSK